MNFKSIAALSLVAVALVVASIAPAEAHHHHNKYQDQLAMQYYMQNQANSGMYNPALAANYGNQYGAGAYGGASPWAAGAVPYGMTSSVPYGVTSSVPYGVTSSVPYGVTSALPSGLTSVLPAGLTRALPYGLANALPFNRTANNFGSGWNHSAYNNPIASRFSNVAYNNANSGQTTGSRLSPVRRFFR